MEEVISVEKAFNTLKGKARLIFIWTLLCVLLSGVFTFFIVTPKYQSSSRIVVNQTQNTSQTITNTDIQTNLNLINTYQSIIKEPIILEDVLKETTAELTIQELSNKITVETQSNSLVFGISVMDENPFVAADLANSIAQTFERKIGDILEVESVTILSEAVPNMGAVSPNIIINLILGLIIGFVLGLAFAVLSEKMDKRIKDIDIIDELGWTNLGSVLEMSNDELKNTRINTRTKHNKISQSISRRRV